MSVKRALKLDSVKKNNPPDETPQKTRKTSLNFYSPTTGTCQMSPFSSPTTHSDKNPRNAPAKGAERGREQSSARGGSPRTGQCPAGQDGFLELQFQVKSSLPRILKIRANLTSLQALEGSRELGTIPGGSARPAPLAAELRKCQTLREEPFVTQAEELQLLKANHGELPAQGKKCHCPSAGKRHIQTCSSTEFLRALLEQSREPLGLRPARHPGPGTVTTSTQALAQGPQTGIM
ncbi:centromere protein R [Pithys albifrons albifrons]|uniref:centromere protein R n=1 Tax=Pithys albifrons albifrons TaxID=3385563 RepID=UPI003A5D00EE